MKVLVTGGCGFIGTNIVFALLENPDVEKVYVLDKMTYASNTTLRDMVSSVPVPELTIYEGDIRWMSRYDEFKDVDFCINLAAESHVDHSIGAIEKFTEVNGFGTYEVAKFCFLNGIKLIHFSTDEVYGDLPMNIEYDDRFEESRTWPKPRNPYSTAKLYAEHLIQLAEIETGIYENCIKVRPCNQFGPFQDKSKLVPKMITNILLGKKVPIYGEGENIREWMYVKNTARAIQRIMEKWQIGCPMPKVMNIGSNYDISNVDMVKTVCELMNKRPNDVIEFIEDPRGNCHDARYAVNTEVMHKILSPFGISNFKDSMISTIEWYENDLNRIGNIWND